jgi:transposase
MKSDLEAPKLEAPKSVRRDWCIPDELWERIQPLLPPPKPHPLGCHNPRVPDRSAMNGIFFVLRTGCQWNALNATGLCTASSAHLVFCSPRLLLTSSSAHRRFQEWSEAGVFERLWAQSLSAQSLSEYDELVGLDWQ